MTSFAKMAAQTPLYGHSYGSSYSKGKSSASIPGMTTGRTRGDFPGRIDRAGFLSTTLAHTVDEPGLRGAVTFMVVQGWERPNSYMQMGSLYVNLDKLPDDRSLMARIDSSVRVLGWASHVHVLCLAFEGDHQAYTTPEHWYIYAPLWAAAIYHAAAPGQAIGFLRDSRITDAVKSTVLILDDGAHDPQRTNDRINQIENAVRAILDSENRNPKLEYLPTW